MYASRLITVAFAALVAVPAHASLADESDINSRLAVVATADMIRKGCGSIDARMVRAFSFLRDIGARAEDLGYSRAEIEAYVEDDAAKAVVEAGARAYLEGMGGMEEAALCETGRAEIAAGSAIGRLLK